MLRRSNPNLNRTLSKTTVKGVDPVDVPQKRVDEKGDAATIIPSGLEIERFAPPLLQFQPKLRRQTSAPTVSKNAVKSNSAKTGHSLTKKENDNSRPASAFSSMAKNEDTNSTTTVVSVLAKRSVSSESNLSTTTTTTINEPVCEALQKDRKLKALCTSLGINQSANTLVGPIEKGQLIIGTLQDSLYELIKMKIKSAERKGEKFHIQQSGLDVAIRALRNAERSLKTIKESKQPILGKARHQYSSSDSLLRCYNNKKTTDAVVRILSTTKEKFDKMGNGMHKFLGGVNLVSALSSSLSPPSSMGLSGYTTRRTTGTSLSTTPVTPYSSGSARAKTASSLISIGGAQRKSITAM